MPLLLALLLLLPMASFAEGPLSIAAAANFRPTIERINTEFTARSGREVTLSSASTGILTSQAMYGAPYHLLLAADAEAPALLFAQGVGQQPFCYAVGQLALVGGPTEGLAESGRSLAIANPDTAPYGRAAQDVLARENFSPERKLVRGNNVLQAYQFWRSGTVDMALVSRSLAGAEGAPIPTRWHRELAQHALVLAQHPDLPAYLAWLRSDTVRSLILDSGYRPCP